MNRKHFYPRSPCGERPNRGKRKYPEQYISIHALLAESDTPMVTPPSYKHNFYPRSPCGERPLHVSLICPPRDFYPRSPCGERHSSVNTADKEANFYPRSPCGERQRGEIDANSQQEFLSTLSLRRATGKSNKLAGQNYISIHALLAESDRSHQE